MKVLKIVNSLTGEASLWGGVTGIIGNVSDLCGDCNLITPEMRKENSNIRFWAE